MLTGRSFVFHCCFFFGRNSRSVKTSVKATRVRFLLRFVTSYPVTSYPVTDLLSLSVSTTKNGLAPAESLHELRFWAFRLERSGLGGLLRKTGEEHMFLTDVMFIIFIVFLRKLRCFGQCSQTGKRSQHVATVQSRSVSVGLCLHSAVLSARAAVLLSVPGFVTSVPGALYLPSRSY